MSDNDFFFVPMNSEEWHYMWKELLNKYGDTIEEDEVTGECWQYMCSQKEGHCFRHRNHTSEQKRIYFFAKFSTNYEDIKEKYKDIDLNYDEQI